MESASDLRTTTDDHSSGSHTILVDTLDAIAEGRKPPMIILNGAEIDHVKDTEPHESMSSHLSQWDGSSVASTPLLSEASVQDDDSSIREPSLDGLEDALEDVQIEFGDDLMECDLDGGIEFSSAWGNGELYISSAEAQPTEQSQALEIESGSQGRQPSTLTTFPDAHCLQTAKLQDMLFDALQFSDHPERKRFFPQTAFTEIIKKHTVQRELQHCFKSPDFVALGEMANIICGTRPFRKMFALLALVGRLSDIGKFLQEDVADDDLPLSKISRPGSTGFQLGRRGSSHAIPGPLKCFDGWNTGLLWIFEDWQWATLAPMFHGGERKDVCHVNLDDRTPLPFTSDSRYGAGSETIRGGFSTVFKVDIHPAHHSFRQFKNGDGRSFAVKCLSSIDESQFNQEVDMLRKFSDDAHPHLISLLATYRQGNKFYLIFPWAEADLQSYWKDVNPRPSMDHDTVLWMGKQCLGIAIGLLKIHRHDTMPSKDFHQTGDSPESPIQIFGRHGDIKSNNILWFRNSRTGPTDRGVLKITDFGLAEFQRSASSIYKSPSKVAVSATYRSPECDIKGGRVGQSHDVWALGCLYLELIAWILGGWELVQRFQKIREEKDADEHYRDTNDGKFFKITNNDGLAVVKPAVAKFVEQLHRHEHCTQYIHEFLGLIQTRMLIVKPWPPQKHERPRIECVELTWELRKLCDACEDTEFALNKIPGPFQTDSIL